MFGKISLIIFLNKRKETSSRYYFEFDFETCSCQICQSLLLVLVLLSAHEDHANDAWPFKMSGKQKTFKMSRNFFFDQSEEKVTF